MPRKVTKGAGEPPNAPHGFSKRIGGTVYTVSVFSSQTSKDTAEDKILRLIKNEVCNSV
jgi:hypothetical protein